MYMRPSSHKLWQSWHLPKLYDGNSSTGAFLLKQYSAGPCWIIQSLDYRCRLIEQNAPLSCFSLAQLMWNFITSMGAGNRRMIFISYLILTLFGHDVCPLGPSRSAGCLCWYRSHHRISCVSNRSHDVLISSFNVHKNTHEPPTRCVKLRVAHAPGMPGTFSPPPTSRKSQVSDPGMHHGTCVTYVPWCMSGSLNRCSGENVPGIPSACATRNFTYLVRGPLFWWSDIELVAGVYKM